MKKDSTATEYANCMKAPNIHFGVKLGQSANQIRAIIPNWTSLFTEHARRQTAEQDMVLLSTRVKQKIGRVSEALGWILVLLLVLGPWMRTHRVRQAQNKRANNGRLPRF